jgi:hypothetical protein
VTLEVGNDWHSIFYTFPGERLNEYGTNNTQNAVLLAEGQVIEIRYPDRFVEALPLEARRSTVNYSDHGHTCEAQQALFGLRVWIHGVHAWLPIESIEVRRSALQRRCALTPPQTKETSP